MSENSSDKGTYDDDLPLPERGVCVPETSLTTYSEPVFRSTAAPDPVTEANDEGTSLPDPQERDWRQEVAPSYHEEAVPCVFMGPPNAGKTTLLGAIAQACMQPPRHRDDYNIKFLAEGNSGKLLREAHAQMYGQRHFDATQEVAEYRFAIRVTRPGTPWRMPRSREALFVVRDGPGGALFPHENTPRSASDPMANWEKQLIEEASGARTLVLCVDACAKHSWRLASLLPDVLGQIATKQPDKGRREPATWRQRLAGRLRRLREHAEVETNEVERWLNADRFLLLLTKADELVTRSLGRRRHIRPAELAERIDPVQQACALLGEGTLYHIHRTLAPGASFAVGMTSAWGFDARNREVFRHDAGTEPQSANPLVRQPQLRDWRPLGLRDAVIYMVSGDVVGTVRRVRTEMLHPGRRLRARVSRGDTRGPVNHPMSRSGR